MAAEIDEIRLRDDSESQADPRLVRVDVSGLRLSDVREVASERADTPVYVEHRAGSTYLVAEGHSSDSSTA